MSIIENLPKLENIKNISYSFEKKQTKIELKNGDAVYFFNDIARQIFKKYA